MDLPERWQAIAPASDEPGEQRSAPGSKKRRQAVAVACVQCRSGKARVSYTLPLCHQIVTHTLTFQCDGVRPRCIRCRDNDFACQYDVPEGVSRAERMKLLKRDSISSRVEEMERIMHVLRSGSDTQASTLLARLRLGERMDVVAKTLPQTPSSILVSNPRYANG